MRDYPHPLSAPDQACLSANSKVWTDAAAASSRLAALSRESARGAVREPEQGSEREREREREHEPEPAGRASADERGRERASVTSVKQSESRIASRQIVPYRARDRA